MQLSFDPASVRGIKASIEALYGKSRRLRTLAMRNSLSGAYSAVPGLQGLGAAHSVALKGGLGSAHFVSAALSKQISWLAQALGATHRSLMDQNDFVARGVDMADEGGVPGESLTAFPTRPPTLYGAFSFVPPVVPTVASLDQLLAYFQATDDAAVATAVASWTEIATLSSTLSAGLKSAAAALSGANHGEVFSRAGEKIMEVSTHCDALAQNAGVMAQSVGQLQAIKAAHYPMVAAAAAEAKAMVEPEKRVLFETAQLAKIHSSLVAAVPAGIPPIRSLMTLRESAATIPSLLNTGMAAIGHQAKSAPKHFAALGDAVAKGASQAGPTLSQAQHSIGDTTIAGSDVATNTASAAPQVEQLTRAPQAVQGMNPGQAANPGAVQQAGQNFGGFAPLTPQAGTAASSGQQAFVRQAGQRNLGQLGMVSADQVRTRTAGFSEQLAIRAGGTPATGTAVGASTAGSALKGLSSSAPLKVGATFAGAGGLGMGANATSFVATPTATGNPATALPAGAASSSGSQSATMARGGSPMMCQGAAPQQGKRGSKVKSVVTTVEQASNVQALVGDKRLVVPGTIGAWVR